MAIANAKDETKEEKDLREAQEAEGRRLLQLSLDDPTALIDDDPQEGMLIQPLRSKW